MPYGIRIKDEFGGVSVEYTDRLTRVLGSVATGTVDGSVFVTPVAGGLPFFSLAGSQDFSFTSTITPTVMLSGNLITWTFPQFGVSNRQSITVVYGVYS